MKDPYQTEKDDHRLIAEESVLRRFVSDRRWERMQAVLDQRSRHISVAVEDIYQPHNASAVLRSCDAFGVQDVHIVENRNRYRVNPGVELGTAQWLSLYRYRSRPANGADAGGAAGTDAADTDAPAPAGAVIPVGAETASESVTGPRSVPPAGTVEAMEALRARGYRIVATTPHRDNYDLETLPLGAGPVAIFFGAEKEGLSEHLLDNADEYLRIPMRGFVESLNISVSAAVTLQRLGDRLRADEVAWQLNDSDRRRILNRWLRSSVRNAGLILERELSGE
jgi:tRNA (guanosine-2'-O-)-methyltransferase